LHPSAKLKREVVKRFKELLGHEVKIQKNSLRIFLDPKDLTRMHQLYLWSKRVCLFSFGGNENSDEVAKNILLDSTNISWT